MSEDARRAGERPVPVRGPDPGRAPLVPRPLAVAAAWTWRLALMVIAAYLVLRALAAVRVVVLSLIGSLLLATFMVPVAHALRRRGVPGAAAALAVLAGFFGMIVGLALLFGLQVRRSVDDFNVNLAQGVRDVERWLVEGPIGLEPRRIDRTVDRATEWVTSSDGIVATGLVSGAVTALEVVAGVLLAFVVLFFLLKDGDRMWRWLPARLGPNAGRHVDEAGRRAWTALGGYMRGQAVVAAVDAVFIGVGVFLLGVPFALPIAVITFFAGFFPIVGAVTAGALAALVALATDGVVTALIVVAIVVVVQQIEGNVLEPVVMARTVKLHPVVILVAVGVGGAAGGLVGAFLAVPAVAVGSAVAGYLWDEVGPEGAVRGRAGRHPEPAGPAPEA